MAKKRAFSYIRMSTEAQLEGHSLERQMDLTRAYAKEKGFELVEDLCDIGLSAHDGANIEKGKLGIFLKALDSGEIEKDSVLLVESLDRLSRKSPRQAFNQFSGILDYGIEIHTIFDRQVYTSDSVDKNPGQLFASIGYMLRAYSESEEKSRRLKKRWQSNRDGLDKKILTTICPAWLKANATKTGFEEISDRTETIRTIFELCVDLGMGAFSIASFLNQHQDKYPRFTQPKKSNRGDKGKHKTGWQKSYVTKILNNPAVYGEFQPQEICNGKRTPVGAIMSHYFPAVIPKERYLLAQARMKSRNLQGGGRKGVSFNNVFTKLIFCGHCGGSVHYIDKGAPPKGGRYLRCSNALSSHHCDSKAWRYEEFEDIFFKFVSDVEFAAVLQKGNDKTRRHRLLEDQQICVEEINRKQSQLDTLLDVQAGMSQTAIVKVREKTESISQDLAALEEKQKAISLELEEINARGSEKIHEEVIAAINEAQQAALPEEKARMRRIIHNQICAVVDKIVIVGLAPDDVAGERNFTVYMKNGGRQTVLNCVSINQKGKFILNPVTGRYVYSLSDEAGPVISLKNGGRKSDKHYIAIEPKDWKGSIFMPQRKT